MKPPEEILIDNTIWAGDPEDTVIVKVKQVIKAMEEYAIQSVECAKDSIEKIQEDNPAISEAAAYEIQEAWEKVHTLEDDLHNSETENDSLKAKISELNMYLENRHNKVTELETEIQTAIRLLQTCVHDNLPINEAINFVQAYWNKHNIFPYEP